MKKIANPSPIRPALIEAIGGVTVDPDSQVTHDAIFARYSKESLERAVAVDVDAEAVALPKRTFGLEDEVRGAAVGRIGDRLGLQRR